MKCTPLYDIPRHGSHRTLGSIIDWSREFPHLCEHDSMLRAARYMSARNLSAIAVIMNGAVIGILTAEQVLKRVISVGSVKTALIDAMSLFPLIVSQSSTIGEVLNQLTRSGDDTHMVVSRDGSAACDSALALVSHVELLQGATRPPPRRSGFTLRESGHVAPKQELARWTR